MDDETALSLMLRALALYDDNGEGATLAACHLQAAIDAASWREIIDATGCSRTLLATIARDPKACQNEPLV